MRGDKGTIKGAREERGGEVWLFGNLSPVTMIRKAKKMLFI